MISADGATVVFNIFEPSGLGGESVVAGFGVWEAASGEITEFGGYGTAALAMSEDAETLLYAVTPISPGSQSEFWVLDRTTGDLTSVGEGHTAAMSGDGAVVAIAVGPLPGSEGLAVIRVADRAELFVGLADVGIGTIMALSGTGDVIAFDTDFPLDPTDRNGQPDIYTLLVH